MRYESVVYDIWGTFENLKKQSLKQKWLTKVAAYLTGMGLYFNKTKFKTLS